jgi:hypothetical protein
MTTATQAKPGLLRNSLIANFMFCTNILISHPLLYATGNLSTILQCQKERVINTRIGQRRGSVFTAENRCPVADICGETRSIFLKRLVKF